MKKFLIALIVIAAIAGMIYFSISKDSEPTIMSGTSARNAIPVKAVTIETGSVTSYVTAPGMVEEVNKSQVFFDTPLRVIKVLVNKNDSVQKGDKLIVLDTSSLEDEMDRLAVQKEIQSITLKKLESGQNLLSLEAQLASAKKALEQAQENHQTALDEYNKQLGFYEKGIIPKTQLDQYEKAAKDVEAVVDNAQLSFENAEKAYQSSVGGLDLDIQSQIKNIELLSSQIDDIRKEINKIRNLEKAPIGGFVTEVNVIEGGYTYTGQPAFTIIDAENLQITAAVSEFNTKDIAIGQQVTITGEALGDDLKLSGEVTAVAPIATRIQTASGTETVVEVSIAPNDTEGVLKPGLNVDCDIITQEKNDVVVAEYNIFIDERDRKQYVLLIDTEKMTMRKQYVILGIYSDMHVEVVDGLKAGDVVVADPQASYGDGDRIRIME